MSETKTWIKDKGLELIIGVILVGHFYWIDAKFDRMTEKFENRFVSLEKEISSINKEIASINNELGMIKTVMIMKNILPAELAHKEEGK
jgi:archaellum component FlaC